VKYNWYLGKVKDVPEVETCTKCDSPVWTMGVVVTIQGQEQLFCHICAPAPSSVKRWGHLVPKNILSIINSSSLEDFIKNCRQK
jgi:hypothetical protein